MQVLFDAGRRWPNARVTGESLVLVVGGDTDGVREYPRKFVDYTLEGPTAAWSRTASSGVWRTLADLDLGDDAQVEGFLRRWGDPLDRPGREEEPRHSTASWANHQGILQLAAKGWDPEQADGICLFTADATRARQALWYPARFSSVLEDLTAAMLEDGSLGFRAKTVHSYLAGTAILAVQEKLPLRRCDHCRGWFSIHRRGTRFCSPSCRASAHTAAQEAE